MRENPRKFSCLRGCACLLAAALILTASSGATAQKNKKDKNSDASNNASQTSALPVIAKPDQDQIDEDIGEMLGAFQVGNVEMMHKYYADNVTFVRSTYDPPVIGWQNYVASYTQEKAAFQAMQLIRRNTYIFTHGDVAWASYQWEFDSMWNGRPYMTRGQTTLVLNKVGGNWLIVHNHTSEILPQSNQQTAAQPAPQAGPTPTAAKP
jgi:ketosteroid isomerase-like protein